MTTEKEIRCSVNELRREDSLIDRLSLRSFTGSFIQSSRGPSKPKAAAESIPERRGGEPISGGDIFSPNTN